MVREIVHSSGRESLIKPVLDDTFLASGRFLIIAMETTHSDEHCSQRSWDDLGGSSEASDRLPSSCLFDRSLCARPAGLFAPFIRPFISLASLCNKRASLSHSSHVLLADETELFERTTTPDHSHFSTAAKGETLVTDSRYPRLVTTCEVR